MKISVIVITDNFINRSALLLLLVAQAIVGAQAQQFAITKLEVTGGKVIINYDLVDTIKAHTYHISVYSSRDNFRAPLEKIEGDAGMEVTPGRNKTITWKFKEELGFESWAKVELEVRGKPNVLVAKKALGMPDKPFVSDFQGERVIRRGKPTIITWTGGPPENILNFALYDKDDKNIAMIPNVPNTGRVDLTVPIATTPGKGYYFLVSDNKKKDLVVRTPKFEVRRKVPLLVKIAPVLVVGGLVAVMINPSTSSENLAGPPPAPRSKN